MTTQLKSLGFSFVPASLTVFFSIYLIKDPQRSFFLSILFLIFVMY